MAQGIDQFPHYASGTVVKGFGRGSKELGIPTANFPNEVVEKLPASFDQGVYYGWAQVDNGPVYKMSMSIGTNPYYNNEKKTMETYIIHEFPEDFYDSNLRVVVLGYIRPMTSFNGLKELIAAIHDDISKSESFLDLPENAKYQTDSFFQQKLTQSAL